MKTVNEYIAEDLDIKDLVIGDARGAWKKSLKISSNHTGGHRYFFEKDSSFNPIAFTLAFDGKEIIKSFSLDELEDIANYIEALLSIYRGRGAK